jgi:Fe-S-cluster containining protein
MKRLSLQEIYSQIPQVPGCKQCGGCCGNIVMTKLEMQNIMRYCEEHKLTFTRPANLVPNRGTRKVVQKHNSAQTLYTDKLTELATSKYVSTAPDGRVTFDLLNGQDCPFLNSNKKCSVYPVRPFICRLYGHVKGLDCPDNPDPNKKYTFTDGQANRLCRQAREAWK